jgi:SAM-dependent methyltransferase/predicted kinase
MIVIIHGPPAAGKSTLARALSVRLGLAVLSRDQLAEELHDSLDRHAQESPTALHHRAHALLMQRVASAARDDEPLIVEATLNPDIAAERLVPLLSGTAQPVVEVFLDAPADTLLRRFRRRRLLGRHRVHDDAKREPRLAAHLRTCRYRPLRIGDHLVCIDTDAPPSDVLAAVLAVVDQAHEHDTRAVSGKLRRRVYYDHEPVYRSVAARGGSGWDDRNDDPDDDSYVGLDEFIGDFVGARRLESVLDLGCGGGQAALRFSTLADRIVAIDYSETAVDLARRNAWSVPHARFEVGDITKLDALTERFEIVLDNHALHCLVEDDHRASMLAAVERVLFPEGLFFSETMSREGRFDPSRFGVAPPRFTTRDQTRRWISANELDHEFRAAGLAIIERRVRAPSPGDPPVGDLLWTVARRA